MFTRWYCGGKSPSPTSLCKGNEERPVFSSPYFDLEEGRANGQTVGGLALLPLLSGDLGLHLHLLLDRENWNLERLFKAILLLKITSYGAESPGFR